MTGRDLGLSGCACAAAVVVVVVLCVAPVTAADSSQPRSSLAELSFEELLEVRVVSASRTGERLADAPATVIVITREQIHDRGYAELSEVFDDLPGMDVVRPYGATYLKSYWRGYRNTIGDPYLVLLDGMVLNHLYFNTADMIVALPLSAVERIEVVYGPASSVYGADAFMGVVNIITAAPEMVGDGSSLSGFVAGGSSERRLVDLVAAYREDSFTLRLAARVDSGDLADGANESYEYSRDRYSSDPALWGGFVTNPAIAGSFSSPWTHRAADLRLGLGDLELGVLWARLENGYGLEYAGDRAQTIGSWVRPELSAFLRGRKAVSDAVTSTTSLRYRESGVGNDSTWIEALTGDDGQRLVRYTIWQAANSSVAAEQAFEVTLSERLGFNAGLEWERKRLQKAYQITAGPALPPAEVDASTYPYPVPPPGAALAANRIDTDDVGIYVQGRFQLTTDHRLHLGVRHDDNSSYGAATTFRTGWVGSWGRFTAKALYGEAFQEPNPRLLYGGWTGSGSDPTLAPESSHTVELSGSWTGPHLSLLASLYRVDNDDTIVSTTDGARNLGERTVTGLDLHLEGVSSGPGSLRLRWWGYYSHLLAAEESELDESGAVVATGDIGDLAPHKLLGGVTVEIDDQISATLRGRFMSSRDTVATNPVGNVPSFTTVDAVVTFDNLFGSGFGAALRALNLLDEEYYHPGVREADAGTTPGSFADDGSWHGSDGYYSSLLAQPGRSLIVTLFVGF